jgi:hypothetical protein
VFSSRMKVDGSNPAGQTLMAGFLSIQLSYVYVPIKLFGLTLTTYIGGRHSNPPYFTFSDFKLLLLPVKFQPPKTPQWQGILNQCKNYKFVFVCTLS